MPKVDNDVYAILFSMFYEASRVLRNGFGGFILTNGTNPDLPGIYPP
jgi:hypothetical protein